MNTLIKILILFLLLTLASAVLIQDFGVDFGKIDYWSNHGFFFLIFLTIFPRLTLLFSSVVSGGLIWWIAWFFTPRFLVAFLATLAYWQTNPLLVIMSWLIAIGGESSEKTVFINRGKPFHFGRTVIINKGQYSQSPHHQTVGDIIDADFTIKKETDLD
jgi:hypothetical protein